MLTKHFSTTVWHTVRSIQGQCLDGTKSLANVVYVEVKKPKGRQSENQIKFQKRCDIVGFDYHVVYSVEDVERLIRRYG